MPIRLRLALASALAVTILMTIAGAFLYLRLAADLAHAVDQELRQRAADVSVLVDRPGQPLSGDTSAGLVERGEEFAEILSADRRVLGSSATLQHAPLLSSAELSQARRHVLWLDRSSVPGLDERARLLATPVARGRDQVVLVVGATLENRAEALRILRTQMLVAGPITILAVTAGGYLLAGGALRPVEAMRRRAEAIGASQPGQRLPLTRTRDELARLADTLNGMLARLEAALHAERRFVADASHELRTPLALLRTELDLALRHPRSAAELRQAIASAAEEADRLSRIAADLLTVAQAEQADLGGLPLRVRPVDAREVVHEAARPFRAKAASLGRALVVEPGPDVVVAADPARLRQALHNLLDNAFEHGAGTVSLGVVGAADTVEFHVTDEGGGFPEGFLPRAFSRFSRADASGRTQGAGLGLSIVAAVAHGHGGVAHAANRPGAGADVSISLPVRSAAARHEDAPMPR